MSVAWQELTKLHLLHVLVITAKYNSVFLRVKYVMLVQMYTAENAELIKELCKDHGEADTHGCDILVT
jgi:ATP-dependent 26S proteasome regulatory subunit